MFASVVRFPLQNRYVYVNYRLINGDTATETILVQQTGTEKEREADCHNDVGM